MDDNGYEDAYEVGNDHDSEAVMSRENDMEHQPEPEDDHDASTSTESDPELRPDVESDGGLSTNDSDGGSRGETDLFQQQSVTENDIKTKNEEVLYRNESDTEPELEESEGDVSSQEHDGGGSEGDVSLNESDNEEHVELVDGGEDLLLKESEPGNESDHASDFELSLHKSEFERQILSLHEDDNSSSPRDAKGDQKNTKYTVEDFGVSPREIDSDLEKSDSLPSLPDSEYSSPRKGFTDISYKNQTDQNGAELIPKPSSSVKKERHISDALPNDIDLLADYDDDSDTSSQNATKLTWSAFKIAYIISAPAFIVGLVLLIMGAVGFPPEFNLLYIGVPVFVIAGLVFVGSTLFLCVYKAKKMRLFEFGRGVDGEVAGITPSSYANDEGAMAIPNVAYVSDDEEAGTSDQGGGDNVFYPHQQGEAPAQLVYTKEGQEENLPL